MANPLSVSIYFEYINQKGKWKTFPRDLQVNVGIEDDVINGSCSFNHSLTNTEKLFRNDCEAGKPLTIRFGIDNDRSTSELSMEKTKKPTHILYTSDDVHVDEKDVVHIPVTANESDALTRIRKKAGEVAIVIVGIYFSVIVIRKKKAKDKTTWYVAGFEMNGFPLEFLDFPSAPERTKILARWKTKKILELEKRSISSEIETNTWKLKRAEEKLTQANLELKRAKDTAETQEETIRELKSKRSKMKRSLNMNMHLSTSNLSELCTLFHL
jgi:hypothetical protein